MNNFNGTPYVQEPQPGAYVAAARGALPFIQKVYTAFLLGILISVGAGAAMFMGPGASVPVGDRTVHVTYAMAWAMQNHVVLIVAFFVTFFLSMFLRRNNLAWLGLVLFTAVTGVFLAPTVFMYTVQSGPGTVGLAGALTVLVFGALTVYAFVSKVDFNFLGAGLFIALIGLIIGGLLNAFFFKSPFTHYLFAWGTVFIFGGYVLYDTSNMLRDPRRYGDVVGCALDLYLNAINLFLAILRIVGGGGRD